MTEDGIDNRIEIGTEYGNRDQQRDRIRDRNRDRYKDRKRENEIGRVRTKGLKRAGPKKRPMKNRKRGRYKKI